MNERQRWMGAALGAAALVAIAPGAQAGAEDPQPAAVVVADRTARFDAQPTSGYETVPDVQPSTIATPGRFNDLYYLDAISKSAGFIQVKGRDNPIQDKPGYLTTTMRVYGNAAAFRSDDGSVLLTSQFTCSGAGISGLSVGSGGVSISGGSTSSTLTWKTSRSNSSEARQNYTEGGHFRCKASNLAPAKTTHRGVAQATYKNTDTRAEDEYSFWW